MKALANPPKTTLLYGMIVLSLAAYAMLRVTNLAQAVQKVKSTADTTAYIRISKEPILAQKFLAGSRPPVFPLLLKLLDRNEERVVWAQGIFSVISWSVLAVAVAASLRASMIRLAAFGLMLLLSLYRYVIGWDSVLLTESISLSFLALFLAAWLWLAQGWRWHKILALLLVSVFWCFSRDTNAWVILMVAFLLLVLVLLHLIDRRYLVLASAFAVMFFFSNLSADIGGRWVFPFQNVLGQRILPDAQAVEFFSKCGMPVTPALLQLSGEFASGAERAFYEDPALAGYRLWLHESGKACYVRWLLSNPLESIRAPLAEFNTLLNLQNMQPFLFSKRFSPILPARLEAMLYPRQYLLYLFVLTLLLAIIALFASAWRRNHAWGVIVGMILLVIPHYFITWHGDIMGIYRHVLAVSIQFYLGVWLLVLFGFDRVYSFVKAQQTTIKTLSLRSAKQ
jgi:hypothetical protein